MAITLPSGFNITNNEPVDARFSLADQTARYGLSSANIYEGLVVYQRDNNTLWILVDTNEVSNANGWQQVTSSELSDTINDRLDDLESTGSNHESRIDTLEGVAVESPLTFTDSTTVDFTRTVDTITAIVIGGVVSGSQQVIDLLPSGVVSGSDQVLGGSGILSSSNETFAEFSSSVSESFAALSTDYNDLQNIPFGILSSSNENFTDFSQSVDNRLDSAESALASGNDRLTALEIETGSISTEQGIQDSRLDQLSSYTSSNDSTNTTQNDRLSQLEVETGSISTEQGVQDDRLTSLEGFTSSIDTTIKTKLNVEGVISGSDQLTSSYDSHYVTLDGEQTINGTKTFNDIVVNGTGSFAYIESIGGSAKIIGDAFVVVNTSTPTSRYAGLSVYDSGSTLSTASFYFDGETNDWGYEYSSSTGVDYAVTIFGPEYSTKGNPTYLTTNTIPKAVDNHHLNDSNISDDGTTITLGSNVQLNGNLNLTGGISGLNVVSGSSQILGGTGIVSSSAQIKPLLPSGTVSGSVQVSYPSLSNIPAGIVSGSSQVTPLLPSGVVSGSIQVSYPSLSNIPSGIVSGSIQITKTLQEVTTAGNTTNTSISITNSTASTSKTTGALIVSGGIGTSGAVFAGGDVVAYASSDRRLKDNILPIENPLQKINQIGGYSFDWNEEKQNIYKGKDYGVIAQEIEEILPELVDTRENGYKAVKYDKLVSLLIEGIKDLSQQVEELKEKINRG